MRREEIQHLLGGYASGTLTPEEQRLLFDAAMDDQQLFNALADEQALKELLDDPESRAYLRDSLQGQVHVDKLVSIDVVTRLRHYWPKFAAVGAIAAGLAVVTFLSLPRSEKPKPVEMAKADAPVLPPAPPPAATTPAPAPAVVPRKPVPIVAAEKSAAAAPTAPAVEDKAAEAPAAAAPPQQNRVQEVATASEARTVEPQRAEPREAELRKEAAPEQSALRMRAPAGILTRGPSASQLYLQAARKRTTADAADVANRGIRYQILRRNSQGEFVQTRLDTRFEAGDEILFQVEANAPGVVSVVAGNSMLGSGATAGSFYRSPPLRLTTGELHVAIVLSNVAASGFVAPAPAQLQERQPTQGFAVMPGGSQPVVAEFRLTVH